MAEQPILPPLPSTVRATAQSLRIVVGAGRREHEQKGEVSPATWSACDALLDALISGLTMLEKFPGG